MRLNTILLEDSNSMFERLRRQLLKFEFSDEWIHNRTFDLDGRTEIWFDKESGDPLRGMREAVVHMGDDWPDHLPNYFTFGRVTKKMTAYGFIPENRQYYYGLDANPYFHRFDGPAEVELSHQDVLVRVNHWSINGKNHGITTKRSDEQVTPKFLSILLEDCMFRGKREARKSLKMHEWEGYTISFTRLIETINKITDDGHMSKRYRSQVLESFRKNTFLFGLSLKKNRQVDMGDKVDVIEHYIKWFDEWSIKLIDDEKYTP